MANISRWYLIAIIVLLGVIGTSLVVPDYLMATGTFNYFLIICIALAAGIGIAGAILSKEKKD